jgi:2-succinyl-5-enolpyruvyl-6-hydroxy-3-cyclohexene-1-carboxylate synthase
MSNKKLNTYWSNEVVNILDQKGVRYACISPGSRNTPLVKAFIENKNIKCFSHIDERSNAYFALGIAKKEQEPVVILTTSGTATANLFPAIIESYLSMIPLIIITADRPEELMDSGENQTINQVNLYGKYVRKMYDISHNKNISAIQIIEDCYDTAKGYQSTKGPVHVNIRFEEPLIDDGAEKISYKITSKESDHKKIQFKIPSCSRPIIICSGLSSNKTADILKLSERLNCFILADSLSAIRHSKQDNVLVYYDHYIDKLNIDPDLILRFGTKPISKKLTSFINKFKNCSFLFDTKLSFNDDCPNIIKSNINNIDFSIEEKTEVSWNEKWKSLESKTKNFISTISIPKESEINLIQTAVSKMDEGDNLFIGNSMPIRIFDQFSGKLKNPLNIYANRGASGIDGIISSALGMAYNSISKNYLIIGDVSFFHDTNGFHILNNESIDLTVIVINNNGGQIFKRLPYAKKPISKFEQFWITPPKTKIKDLANLYKLDYSLLTVNEYKHSIASISNLPGVKIIEIIVDSSADIKVTEEIKTSLV